MAIDRIDGGDVAGYALREHLLRIDHQLAQAGVVRQERDATLQQLAEQFYDQLPQRPESATREQVDAALAALGSELAYRGDEPTVGRLLRMLVRRLGGGASVPLALNDKGERRIVWGELVKRMAFMALMSACIVLLLSSLTRMPLSKAWANALLLFGCVVLGVTLEVNGMPVHALPRAEDWPREAQRRHRWAWLVMCTGILLLVLAALVGSYVAAAVVLGCAILPLDLRAETAAWVVTWMAVIGTRGIVALRRRLRRQRVARWAAQHGLNHLIVEGQGDGN